MVYVHQRLLIERHLSLFLRLHANTAYAVSFRLLRKLFTSGIVRDSALRLRLLF